MIGRVKYITSAETFRSIDQLIDQSLNKNDADEAQHAPP